MTPSQDQALAEIRRLLIENFDSWVIAARYTSETNEAQINSFWNGPLDSVVGLAAISQLRLSRIVMDTSGPAEPFSK